MSLKVCTISEIKSGLDLNVKGVDEDLHFTKKFPIFFQSTSEKASLRSN